MRKLILAVIPLAVLFSACETPTTQRYAISADNNQDVKALNASGVGVGAFTASAPFSPTCRAMGPMQVADGLTHTEYIRKAFEDELKVGGAFAAANAARVTLTGTVTKLEFSSTRAVTGGSWTIDLTLTSSNGKSLRVEEYYEFNSGFAAQEACRNVAEAYSRAVQNLIGKALRHSGFRALVA